MSKSSQLLPDKCQSKEDGFCRLPINTCTQCYKERQFSLEEALEIWDAGRERGIDDIKSYNGAIAFDKPDKKQYFQTKFGITL